MHCGAAIRSWTQILNYEKTLWSIARASLHLASAKFRHWPLELAFHSHRGRLPLCTSVVARNMATLLMADLHPVGGPEIWSGNKLSTSMSSRISMHLDDDGCPLKHNLSPRHTFCSEKSPRYGNTGSIIVPKSYVGVPMATLITSRSESCNGRTPPCNFPF
jgi:hypothetical protein